MAACHFPSKRGLYHGSNHGRGLRDRRGPRTLWSRVGVLPWEGWSAEQSRDPGAHPSHGAVAQPVEQVPFKHLAGGSSPPGPTFLGRQRHPIDTRPRASRATWLTTEFAVLNGLIDDAAHIDQGQQDFAGSSAGGRRIRNLLSSEARLEFEQCPLQGLRLRP